MQSRACKIVGGWSGPRSGTSRARRRGEDGPPQAGAAVAVVAEDMIRSQAPALSLGMSADHPGQRVGVAHGQPGDLRAPRRHRPVPPSAILRRGVRSSSGRRVRRTHRRPPAASPPLPRAQPARCGPPGGRLSTTKFERFRCSASHSAARKWRCWWRPAAAARPPPRSGRTYLRRGPPEFPRQPSRPAIPRTI